MPHSSKVCLSFSEMFGLRTVIRPNHFPWDDTRAALTRAVQTDAQSDARWNRVKVALTRAKRLSQSFQPTTVPSSKKMRTLNLFLPVRLYFQVCFVLNLYTM